MHLKVCRRALHLPPRRQSRRASVQRCAPISHLSVCFLYFLYIYSGVYFKNHCEYEYNDWWGRSNRSTRPLLCREYARRYRATTCTHADVRDVDLAVTKGAPNLVKYRAAPFTGFFLDHADFKHDSSNYTGRMEYIYKMQNMTFGDDGALMASCKVCHSNDPHHNFCVRTLLWAINNLDLFVSLSLMC